ncbi:MAG TPA: hypothetical protein VGE85_06195 [Terracidiphilus sp.]|jgi:hypothetical protein
MNLRKHLFCFVAIVAGLVICAPSGMLAKDKPSEAKKWLAAYSDPAEINVDGVWNSSVWGKMILHQEKGAREVTGTADNWEIEGVVSGKKVFLAFIDKGYLIYTAEAALNEDGTLIGNYAKGILKPGTGIDMVLLKDKATTASPVVQSGEAGGATAHVVVFRKHYHNCPQVKAQVMIDGKEAADVQNGRYLTLNLPPGKHLIGTSKVGYYGSQTEELDLAPGSTTYINYEFPSAWVCTIEIQKTDAAEAQNALSKLKPNDANRVKIPEMVSLDPIGK